MRIVSWNVNGLRACARKGFGSWLAACGADVVAMQEVRARREQLPPELLEAAGWHLEVVAGERAGYSGVGMFSRQPPGHHETTLGAEEFDREGRLQVARFGALTVANSYFPNGNGKNRDLSRIPYKLRYYQALFARLEPARQAGEAILVLGDFNTAVEEIDLARPQQNRQTSGFRPEERDELRRWLENGWTDCFRHFHQDAGHYTWWSQRRGVRERNVGWRIDYMLASPAALEQLTSSAIHPEVMGSDHCPISVELNDQVLEPRHG